MKLKNLSAVVFLLTAMLCATLTKAQEKQKRLEGITSLNVWSDDEDGSKETELKYTDNGQKFRVKLEGKKIIEIYLDGKKLEPSEFAKYESRVKDILEQVEEDRKQAAIHREQAEKHRAQAEKDREQAEMHRKEADQYRAQADKEHEQAQAQRKQAELQRDAAEKQRGHAEVARAEADKHRQHAEELRGEADKMRAKAEIDRKEAEVERKAMDQLIDDVVGDKLANNDDAVRSIKLDGDEFWINGEKQPADVQKKYSRKYLNEKRKRINFTRSRNGMQLSTD